ncbi:hypothetical protein PspLS_11158 [Pyricularia sp. CBS 133598]|nr:hypothetical protein PspLS_11158 [Pyricularia sp. CBS 133598]
MRAFKALMAIAEVHSLKDAYLSLFERSVDGLELHEACISGNLVGFVESALGGLDVPRRLFQNQAPLRTIALRPE